jgi:hypothetical protein
MMCVYRERRVPTVGKRGVTLVTFPELPGVTAIVTKGTAERSVDGAML